MKERRPRRFYNQLTRFSGYGSDAFYCQPGIGGAHEKGGIEGEVGRFRRTGLSSMPVVDFLAELNERVRRWDELDDRRRIGSRLRTVGQDFAAEQPLLQPLPAEVFDPGLVLTPRVDRSALITVRMAKYSVPARLIGRRVRVSLRASDLRVFDGRTLVSRHPRMVARGGETVDLDHYLEVLRTKPGALPGSTALAQARAAGTFTAAHEAFWAAARRTDGDTAGTRALIEVLLLHCTMAAGDVAAGLVQALKVGAVTADVVAVEARRHAISTGGPESDRGQLDSAPAGRPGRGDRRPARRHPAAALGHRLRRPPCAAPPHQPITCTNRGDRLMSVTTATLRRRMTEQAATAAIDQACRRLRLPTIRALVDEAVTVAQKEQLSYAGFLAELLLAECDDRARRRTARRVKAAGFPRDKWLGDFDFDANPNVNPATIHTLATAAWVRTGQPLCLIGDSGTGKSHLLIGLGTAAAEKGFRVKYILATRLVNELVEAADDKTLARTIARYGRVDLLIIAELG